MEPTTKVWESLIAAGPLAVVLAVGFVILWRRYLEQGKELTALHQARVEDLKALLRRDDDS